ncbi:hypothetical protein B0H16DRAFT_786633 [Mycena metata]|uniref:Uncharacterized protein n=1 Tax=Mycena metata TaxID=1033252 RepID=A0AAD7J1K7_9AGAR|nr:hypothetical protein B0H16DRAFT_786633 [Mycena metata]
MSCLSSRLPARAWDGAQGRRAGACVHPCLPAFSFILRTVLSLFFSFPSILSPLLPFLWFHPGGLASVWRVPGTWGRMPRMIPSLMVESSFTRKTLDVEALARRRRQCENAESDCRLPPTISLLRPTSTASFLFDCLFAPSSIPILTLLSFPQERNTPQASVNLCTLAVLRAFLASRIHDCWSVHPLDEVDGEDTPRAPLHWDADSGVIGDDAPRHVDRGRPGAAMRCEERQAGRSAWGRGCRMAAARSPSCARKGYVRQGAVGVGGRGR